MWVIAGDFKQQSQQHPNTARRLIQGNLVDKGEARVVVNQSTAAILHNWMAILKWVDDAEVVIANPAGIAVNGGGFINASRATLTTYQPQYQAGDFSGFKIRQGNAVIAGHGLMPVIPISHVFLYANKITLISTTEQAGIRNQGQLFASSGNVAIDANGRFGQ